LEAEGDRPLRPTLKAGLRPALKAGLRPALKAGLKPVGSVPC
jgi:hypothetical protein